LRLGAPRSKSPASQQEGHCHGTEFFDCRRRHGWRIRSGRSHRTRAARQGRQGRAARHEQDKGRSARDGNRRGVLRSQKARKANGQERILVNCAGTGNAIKTASRDKKTGETRRFPTDAFNFIIQINLVGTYRCIAISAQGMLSLEPLPGGERGAIVNTASVAAQDGQIGQAAYTASKAGINGLTLVVARDLAQEGIRCNTIMPGLFNTPLLGAAPEQVKQALGAQVPFPPRLGNPPEYASLALEMITNSYFNGECVRLDGAIRMAPR
jgi:NAD(P)-dependent dehydrogenase (short-subunit alcohol dehydrogenase family)